MAANVHALLSVSPLLVSYTTVCVTTVQAARTADVLANQKPPLATGLSELTSTRTS